MIEFVLNYPKLSKLIHCLVSLTCTNSGLVVCRTNNLVLCKKYVIKILGLKKLCSWMLWKTESKVLVWHKILLKRLRLCLWKIWSANLEIQSKDLDLKMVHVLNFSADLNLVFAESFMRFIWSNITQKSPFLFQDLKLKLYWLAVNLPVNTLRGSEI